VSATDTTLVINAGSSSIKFAVYAIDSAPARKLRGLIDGLGTQPRFAASDDGGNPYTDDPLAGAPPALTHAQALELLFAWLDLHGKELRIVAAGHRVVHGADLFASPVRVDDTILAQLDALVPLARLHQPHNLAAIRALARLRPQLPQVACFDTAFHRTQRPLAQAYALPHELSESGVKRYGFHGLSYQYIAGVLPDHLGVHADGRVIVAHLGAGASLCALRERRSCASTMGFTVIDGVMMGTRCGSLDPGVVLYLMRERGMSLDAVDDLLYRRSGLLGVSGISADMRVLLASEAPRARAAVELFAYRVVREIGSLSAAIGGLDALVFTGGIGEHAAPVREMICRQSAWLGVELDNDANARNATRISTAGARASTWVIPTDEEIVIARDTVQTLALQPVTPA
jgi:acetate kinase